MPYRQAARAELRLGNYAAAMDWYDRANAAIPMGDPWPNIEAGNAALEHKDIAEAERRYRAALVQSPNHAGALSYLAVLLYQQGRTVEVINYMELVNDHAFRCGGLKLLRNWYEKDNLMVQARRAEQQYFQECAPQ